MTGADLGSNGSQLSFCHILCHLDRDWQPSGYWSATLTFWTSYPKVAHLLLPPGLPHQPSSGVIVEGTRNDVTRKRNTKQKWRDKSKVNRLWTSFKVLPQWKNNKISSLSSNTVQTSWHFIKLEVVAGYHSLVLNFSDIIHLVKFVKC